MKLNNKGVLPAGMLFSGGPVIGSVFTTVVFLSVVYQLGIADNSGFQAKKAQKLCEEGYRGISCSEVDEMDKAEILAYIKDDIEVPQVVMRPRLGG